MIEPGQRYGRLTVVKRIGTVNRKSLWECQCECGGVAKARGSDLTCGKVMSCGCLRKETAKRQGKANATHGMTGIRIWKIWSSMKSRCKSDPCYRNVSVCKEWESFDPFYRWAMEHGYADNLSIDRIDSKGNYEPNNCRWVTMKQQENNRSNNVRIEINGESRTVAEWSEISGISSATLYCRIKAGWPESEMLLPVSLSNSKIRREKK